LDLEALCSAAEKKDAEALLGMKHVLLWSRLDDEQRDRG
jgi:hypothetical protein